MGSHDDGESDISLLDWSVNLIVFGQYARGRDYFIKAANEHAA